MSGRPCLLQPGVVEVDPILIALIVALGLLLLLRIVVAVLTRGRR